MSNWAERLATGMLVVALAGGMVGTVNAESTRGGAATAKPSPKMGLGREALPAEIAAWDTDVRPDGRGLPAADNRRRRWRGGSGSHSTISSPGRGSHELSRDEHNFDPGFFRTALAAFGAIEVEPGNGLRLWDSLASNLRGDVL